MQAVKSFDRSFQLILSTDIFDEQQNWFRCNQLNPELCGFLRKTAAVERANIDTVFIFLEAPGRQYQFVISKNHLARLDRWRHTYLDANPSVSGTAHAK